MNYKTHQNVAVTHTYRPNLDNIFGTMSVLMNEHFYPVP